MLLLIIRKTFAFNRFDLLQEVSYVIMPDILVKSIPSSIWTQNLKAINFTHAHVHINHFKGMREHIWKLQIKRWSDINGQCNHGDRLVQP